MPPTDGQWCLPWCLLSANEISLLLVPFVRCAQVLEQPRIQQLVVVHGIHEVEVRVVAQGDAIVVHYVWQLPD